MNICQVNQVFPYYWDLDSTFTLIYIYLAIQGNQNFLNQILNRQNIITIPLEMQIRLFLHTTTTIEEQRCPDTYLQLLSFYDVHDGLVLLCDLVFYRSPQLKGSYHDFRAAITNLTILPGEHLSKFYQFTIQLYTEIQLSSIPNGSSTDLCYRFLELLRNTGCSTIQGLTLPYWKAITTHRCNPNHLKAPLPWSFKEVYNELDNSNITNLPGQPNSSLTYSPNSLLSPIAAFGSSSRGTLHTNNNLITSNNKYTNNNNFSSSNTKPLSDNRTIIGIHQTRDGRKFISTSNTTPSPMSSSKISCTLCYNKHVNPWHQTENCPFKHPTHILDKDTHERVLQHNAVFGSEKQNFSKTQDLPHAVKHLLRSAALGHRVTLLDETTTDVLDTTEPLPSPPDTDLALTRLEEGTPLAPDDEIIESEYFDYPISPAATFCQPTSLECASDDIITDHLQYLSYHS
jgi:hypothetical protein